MDDLDGMETDPDCPNCGTRCRPLDDGWYCFTCGVWVLSA